MSISFLPFSGCLSSIKGQTIVCKHLALMNVSSVEITPTVRLSSPFPLDEDFSSYDSKYSVRVSSVSERELIQPLRVFRCNSNRFHRINDYRRPSLLNRVHFRRSTAPMASSPSHRLLPRRRLRPLQRCHTFFPRRLPIYVFLKIKCDRISFFALAILQSS